VPCATFQRDYGPKLVTVGQLTSTTSSGFNARLTYAAGSSSSLGIGYSGSASYGTFSQSGTASTSNTATIGFPALTGPGSVSYRTNFTYGLYYGTGCSPRNIFYYEARPTSFAGGATTSATSAPSFPYCTRYAAGSSYTKSSTSATTQTLGVSISGQLGVNLSSKTGYTTTTTISISFTSTKNLCGSSGLPGSSPGRVSVN
jgi:hypothetical protein